MFNMGYKKAILNDTNPHIIQLYKEIQVGKITPQIVKNYLIKEGEELRNAGDNGYDHFRLIKNRFNENPNSLDFIFLSRAGFNGMMRFNKKGQWNIPFCKKPE
ncbi:MAG TPA: DNA adenine methylase, partial [Bacteroidales bacterium]|nr:DNA adenine methylase [Bacteroidales bacterium]